jgi:hypothetical protein
MTSLIHTSRFEDVDMILKLANPCPSIPATVSTLLVLSLTPVLSSRLPECSVPVVWSDQLNPKEAPPSLRCSRFGLVQTGVHHDNAVDGEI